MRFKLRRTRALDQLALDFASSRMDHLSQRFDHGHYYLNSLLCLAFPAVLASSFSTRSLALLLLAAPLLLSLSVWSRASTDNFGQLPFAPSCRTSRARLGLLEGVAADLILSRSFSLSNLV